MRNYQDIKVVSKNIDDKHQQQKKQIDTLLVEDIFKAIQSDYVPEYEMGICHIDPYNFNPIQRDYIFRMPGKPQRENISEFAKYNMQSQCLCKKFNYNVLRDNIYKHIDAVFVEMEKQFKYKMQKSLLKQVDIELFKQDLIATKALKPKTKSFQDRVDSVINQHVEKLFNKMLLKRFLDNNQLKEATNSIFKKFQEDQKKINQFNYTKKQISLKLDLLTQKIRFSFSTPTFLTNFVHICKSFQTKLQHYQVKQDQLNKLIHGRQVLFDEIQDDLSQIQENMQRIEKYLNQQQQNNKQQQEVEEQLINTSIDKQIEQTADKNEEQLDEQILQDVDEMPDVELQNKISDI